MNVKRYVAESAREALRRVKEELGPDAIVVSNKAVPGGVEIMALSADGLEALSRPAMAGRPSVPAAARPAPVAAPAAAAPAEAGEDYTVTLSSRARKQPAPPPFQPWQPPRHPAAAEDRPRPRPLPPRPAEAPSREQVTAALRQAGEADAALREGPQAGEIAVLMREMKAIKGLLEQQLAGFAWGEMARNAPGHAVLLAEMLDAGFSGLLARRLMDEMPSDMEAEEGRRWLKTAINRRLRTPANDADLVDRGGVYALVGPTGVGKTTTTAKLAARCVVRHGADRLALLTTDGYRIGAHEQLRIYGRILGVPVHVVRDGADLRHTLADLRDKHMVLIDTVGMSQRDRMVAEQAAMLAGAGEVRRLLLLNATSRGDTLDDVVRAYAGEDLAGCILTKVDEAMSLAPGVDALVRHGLQLAYVANGQRVPEDLHLPNRSWLLHRIFRQPASASPHRLQGAEAGLALGAGGFQNLGASLA